MVRTGRKRVLCNLVLLSSALQCHTQIHCAISKIDVENDIQALVEETAVLSTENKSEFLLTDYFVSMGWKEVSFMGNLSQSYTEGFILKRIESNCKGNVLFGKQKY